MDMNDPAFWDIDESPYAKEHREWKAAQKTNERIGLFGLVVCFCLGIGLGWLVWG